LWQGFREPAFFMSRLARSAVFSRFGVLDDLREVP